MTQEQGWSDRQWDIGMRRWSWRAIVQYIQAVAIGAGPIGEKFSELGDAMVSALVPNPCHDSSCNPSAGWIESIICRLMLHRRGEENPTVQDDEGQGGGLHRRSEEGNEDEGGGSCSPHHDSSQGEEKRDEVGFRHPGSDSG